VLRVRFEEEEAHIGERIGVYYLGYYHAKGYKRYVLLDDRAAAPLSSHGEAPDGAGDPFAD